MKKYLPIIACFTFTLMAYWGCQSKPSPNAIFEAKALFNKDLATFTQLVDGDLVQLAERSNHQDSLQKTFLACRVAYKKIEHFTEYFFPTTSRLVNGPALPEYELEENKAFEPGGLQVIEELIFPFDTTKRQELLREIKKMRVELRRYDELWKATDFTEAHLFDAVRLQLFRNITLGISGFDTPICQTAIPELAVSLQSLGRYVALFEGDKSPQIDALFQKAATFTARQVDFNHFDRLKFTTDFINPLTSQLLDYQNELGFKPFDELRALRSDAKTLFDANVFNADYYVAEASSFGNIAKVTLGRKLFYDNILSANNTRNCGSCHQPSRAFTDGRTKSANLTGGSIARNAPTILYAALQKSQFHDQRVSSLEAQTQDVIQNRDEMHGSLPEACDKLQKNAEYVALFKKAFPKMQNINPYHIMNGLASYERSLMPFNSRFDHYMRGQQAALNGTEKRGFNIFMGKGKCGICHFAPIFNGTVPPQFSKSESEVIGIMTAPMSKKLDADLGKGRSYPTLPDLKYAFKIPTVRNVALTAPYMHNGAYRTLEEVIEFYNHGGAAGLGLELPNQTLPADHLNLTKQEKADLVAFMHALSDEVEVKKSNSMPTTIALAKKTK